MFTLCLIKIYSVKVFLLCFNTHNTLTPCEVTVLPKIRFLQIFQLFVNFAVFTIFTKIALSVRSLLTSTITALTISADFGNFCGYCFLLCTIDVFKLSCKLEEYLSTSTPCYCFIKSIIMVFVFSSELLLS